MSNIQFKVFSELYGWKDAVITDVNHAISTGWIPCGDGCDYRLTLHEIEQLRTGVDTEDLFVPSSSLAYPLNLVAMMIPEGTVMLIPQHVRLDQKQYGDLKKVMLRAGGKYSKNTFVFEEEAEEVYYRIINGEDYNLKKKYQFFATPAALADKLVEMAELVEGDEILEPSAGQGAIIEAVLRTGKRVSIVAVEIMEQNYKALHKMVVGRKIKSVRSIFCGDFMTQKFNSTMGVEPFTKVVMNPPFTRNQDILHFRRAYELLVPGGILVSVMSIHWETSTNKAESDFRKWLDGREYEKHQIPAGAFKESGTNVPTVIIKIIKGNE